MPNNILCVGGLDPSGCAGISADAYMVQQLGGHALSIASSLTVQTENQALQSHAVANGLFAAQLRALLSSSAIQPQAVKVGLVQDGRHWFQLKKQLPKQTPLVIDPVLKSSSGLTLAHTSRQWRRGLQQLASQATLITPNQAEWEALRPLIADTTPSLVTGKRVDDNIVNELWLNGTVIERFSIPHIAGEYRGTGCRLSSAIAFYLATGEPLNRSIELAMQATAASIGNSYTLGDAAIPRPINPQLSHSIN